MRILMGLIGILHLFMDRQAPLKYAIDWVGHHQIAEVLVI